MIRWERKGMSVSHVDTGRIDDAVLALLFLTLHPDEGRWRAWKSHDWEVLNRLYKQGWILDPVGKAKSVVLTDKGRTRCEEAFHRLFTRQGDT